jgi:hypothetical protein
MPLEARGIEARGIGHNKPPTPYEQASAKIEDLYGEATYWLDGAAVECQDHADGLSTLLNMIRDARKEADEARKIEAKPFDDGKAEVQARYNPLLKKADLATDACKKAIAPWLDKQAAEKAAAAAESRRIADEKAHAAQEALRATEATNLAEREAAEQLVRDAKKAETTANRAARDTAKAGVGIGRATSLRTSYKPVLADAVVAARHFWATDRQEIEALLIRLAEQEVRNGKREIPGFVIEEVKTAV